MSDHERLNLLVPETPGGMTVRILSKCFLPETAKRWAELHGRCPDFFAAVRYGDRVSLSAEGSAAYERAASRRGQGWVTPAGVPAIA